MSYDIETTGFNGKENGHSKPKEKIDGHLHPGSKRPPPPPLPTRVPGAAQTDRDSIRAFFAAIFVVIIVVCFVANRITSSNDEDDLNYSSHQTENKYKDSLSSTIRTTTIKINYTELPSPSTTTPTSTTPTTQRTMHPPGKREYFSCTTTECMSAVQQLKSSMDESIDPCEDFYKYACQGWINSNIPPKAENSTQPFTQRYMKNIELVQGLIENGTGNSTTEIKARDFYISCTSIKDNMTLSKFGDEIRNEIKRRPGSSEWGPNSNLSLFHLGEKFARHFRLDDTDSLSDPELTPKLCALFVQNFFPELIARLFVQNYLLLEEVASIKSLISRIRSTYLSTLSSTLAPALFPWMDYSSRIRIQEEIEKLPIIAGHTKSIMDTNWVAGIYKNAFISPNGDNFFKNLLNLVGARANVKETSIHNDAITKTSAYYSPLNNEVFVPAGMIQFPLYHHSYPGVLKYAQAGTTIGHELTHALVTFVEGFTKINPLILDILGIDYQKSVATFQTRMNYKARSTCVDEQYSNFTVPLSSSNFKLMVNGTLTLHENVADIIGIQIAFKAFMENSALLQKGFFPGMDKFTKEQIFFISSAQKHCQSFTNSTMERKVLGDQVATDVHSPASVRVLGALSNFDEFSKAFKCPLNSRYNPTRKCIFLRDY